MKINKKIILLIFVIAFFLSRFISLTKLPVFADESIYIRWAQMIVHDPQQYLFVPLYDGKSPLFIWFLIPLLNLTPLDPLWAARFLSVIAGAFTLCLLVAITREVGGSRRAAWLTAFTYLILPFTLFHDRMGLIDGLLTTFLAASFLCLLKWRKNSYHFFWAILAGLFWGLALLTKTSALYYAMVPWGLLAYDKIFLKKSVSLRAVFFLIGGGTLGLCLLLLLRVSPLFPFLFKRSSDFAFTIHEIVTELPRILSTNLYRVGKWMYIYLTPGVLLTLATFFVTKKKSIGILFVCAGLFLIPFLLSGKLLSSRYFLPVVIWFIPATALVLEIILIKHRTVGIFFISLIAFFSIRFAYPLYTDPGKTPFAHEDVVQYLTEWSAGYGNAEVRDYIAARAREARVVVATEGYFGTLPDGLLMYFDRSSLIKNLEIYGIGQPISGLPKTLIEKARVNETYLVVNQHRFFMNPLDPMLELVATYPRPYNGPSLLLYRITP